MGDANRNGFARQVSIALRVAGATDIRYDEGEFRLNYRRPDGSPMVANLGNVFIEWGDVRNAELTEKIRGFAAMLVASTEVLTEWEAVADRLRPVLNSPQLMRWSPETRSQSIGREFLPFVAEMVVVDHPDQMQYVQNHDLGTWGVTADVVFDRARENLTSHLLEPEGTPEPDRKLIMQLVEQGNQYWASHLLIDGWLNAMGRYLGGRPVAFVPNRSSGMTLVRDDPDTVRLLLEHGEKTYLESPRAVSPQAYTVDDAGRVVPYSTPERDGPLWTAVRRSEQLIAHTEYAAQKEYHAEDVDHPGFFASYTLKPHAEGDGMDTIAVWGEGVYSLLPVTDYVVIINEAHDHFIVPFDTVVRVVGLKQEPDLWPVRYRTPPWMTAQQNAALRAEAVEP